MIVAWLAAGAAWACGGPEYMALDAPLLPAEAHLGAWLDGYDGYELQPAPVTRFLYGVHASNPSVYADLEVFSYGAALAPGAELAPPSLDAFQSALKLGDRAKAHAAAVAVVNQILDLPSVLAEPHAALLRRPIEYLELEPTLGGVPQPELVAWFTSDTAKAPKKGPLARAANVRGLAPDSAAKLLASDPANPRAASLRWLALRDAMARDIPNGWSVEDIQPRVNAATWARLLSATDAWLVAYPGHPLADLVRGKQLRLHYLRGDPAAAWKVALDLYSRHPARAAGEMRFLLAQGYGPTGVDADKLPPELLAALVPTLSPTTAQWTAWWRLSEAQPQASWSLPLQERLLYTLVTQNAALPPGFPAAAAPSATWARLRLGLVAQAGDADGAWEQSEKMTADVDFVGPIRAWVRLTRGDWAGAIREPGVDAASRRYLIEVLASEDVLRELITDKDPAIADDARLSLALRRRAATGRWDEGVQLLTATDPARAKLWQQAAKLRDDLAAARYLREQAGAIFIGNRSEDVVWYRSLPTSADMARAPKLPFQPADELAATSAWLTRSFATYAALERYAGYLDGVDTSRPTKAWTTARGIVTEADTAYNALLNYGSSDSYAWRSVLPDSAPAKSIRRVGAAIP